MPTPIFLALTLLIEPELTPTKLACTDVAALLDLVDAERETFASLCKGTDAPKPAEREQLYLSLNRLLRVGDWRATLAMRTLADPTRFRTVYSAGNPTLELTEMVELDLTAKFGQCLAVGTAITQFVKDVEEDRLPRPVGLEILRTDPICAKQFQGVAGEKLVKLINSHVLVTYVGEAKDQVGALALDSTSPRLVHESPVFEHPQHAGVRFLLVPRGQRLLMVVKQVEHDIAWTTARIYNRNTTLARQSHVACIDSTLTIDPGVQAEIVVDGEILERHLIGRRRHEQHDPDNPDKPKEQRDQQRAVINVPAGEHDIMIVVHGQMRDKQVTIPAAIAARLSIERKAETTANTCTALEHDFHGLGTNQSRYGIARITVDEHCAASGLWSPRVRQHIEQYAGLLEDKGVRLEQLDAWSDALAEFQLLQQGGEASEALLDDRKRSAELAETVMRQGVDYLLFFELRCDMEGGEVDVFGTAIDLGSFSLRPKSGGRAETDGLRNSRLHTAPRARVREALDVVLGDLFHVGHVLLVDAPSGERDDVRHIRVAAEFPPTEKPNLEVAVFRVKNRDICDRLEGVNSLARDSDLGDLRTELGTSTKSRDKWLLSEQSGELPDDADLSGWTDQFNITGLPTGTYVAWIADADAQRYDARCFEVDERTFEYWVALNAGARTRGKLTDFNPRHDRVTHLRLTSGLRIHSRRYFTAGALVGYEHIDYESSTTPSWDEYDAIDYAPDGSVSLDYSRNGLLVGAFVGVDVPFCLAGRGGQIQGCKLYLRRLSWFIEAAILGNLGFIDLKSLPTALAEEADVLDPDLDVALQGGIRILATPVARFGIVLGSQWTDVTAILGSSRTPTGQDHPAAAFTFDYAWRWTVGLEVSLARRAR